MQTDIRGNWKLSRYIVVSVPVALLGSGPARILYSTRSCVSVQVPESTWTQLRSGVWDLSEERTRWLAERQILVPSDEDELEAVLAENEEACQISTELLQVIQPSASCQLDCFYCGQEHRPVSMSATDQGRMVDQIRDRLQAAQDHSKGFESILVGWFGAEPLLGMPAMRTLSPQLRQLAGAYGCTYGARVVTNGLRLTVPVALELQTLHQVNHVEVTLDGVGSAHDTRRPTKAGKASFTTIVENVISVAHDHNVTLGLTVRCNVDESNVDGVPALIDLLVSNDLQQRVSLYFSPVYAWGNDADKTALSHEDFAHKEVEWLAQMIAAGFPADLLPTRKKIVCLATQREARVTDAYGNQFNCTEAPYVPSYGTPNLYQIGRLGTSGEKPLFFHDWNNSLRNDAAQCSSCRILPVCGGACPKAWSDGKKPCPSTRANLADRILLNFAQSRLQSDRP